MFLLDDATSPLSDEDLASLYFTLSGPTLRLSFVSSLDGAIVADGKGSQPLSGAADQRVYHLLRDLSDGILVGAGTFRAEAYGPLTPDVERRESRVRRGLAEAPTLVVVSGTADLSPHARAFREAHVRPIVLTCENADEQRRKALSDVADVWVIGETSVDLTAALQQLRKRGLERLLCEGGAALSAALFDAGLVDEMCLTLSPQVVGAPLTLAGSSPLTQAYKMDLAHILRDGDTLLARYVKH